MKVASGQSLGKGQGYRGGNWTSGLSHDRGGIRFVARGVGEGDGITLGQDLERGQLLLSRVGKETKDIMSGERERERGGGGCEGEREKRYVWRERER